MTNIFAVVGEHRAEPSRLLLIGDDGHFYAYGKGEGQPTEVQPSEEWQFDPDAAPDPVAGFGVRFGSGLSSAAPPHRRPAGDGCLTGSTATGLSARSTPRREPRRGVVLRDWSESTGKRVEKPRQPTDAYNSSCPKGACERGCST